LPPATDLRQHCHENLFGTGARAQDLSGNWQGTLKAGKDLRVIFNFYKGDKDPWNAKMYSLDHVEKPSPN
jgi:hypothetical protein